MNGYVKKRITRDCLGCGVEFTTHGLPNKLYCTKKCRGKRYNIEHGVSTPLEKRHCIWCEALFQPRQKTHMSCTRNCRSQVVSNKKKQDYMDKTGYDNVPNHGARGAMSELRIMVDLMARGYMVFRNCSSNGSTDLIALWPGPNQTPIRFEVKTVQNLNSDPSGRYAIEEYFDHWAKVTPAGKILYDPELPKQEMT